MERIVKSPLNKKRTPHGRRGSVAKLTVRPIHVGVK